MSIGVAKFNIGIASATSKVYKVPRSVRSRQKLQVSFYKTKSRLLLLLGRYLVPYIRTEAGRSRLCYSAVKAYNDIPMKPGTSLKTVARRNLLERRDS